MQWLIDSSQNALLERTFAGLRPPLRPGEDRSILTFVDVDNVPSLRGCRSAGSRPYRRRIERWRLLRCRASFE